MADARREVREPSDLVARAPAPADDPERADSGARGARRSLGWSDEPDEELAPLVAALQRIEGRLGRGGAERHAPALLDAVLDALPASIVLLDPTGRVVRVNAAWSRFGAANGLPAEARSCVGWSYLAVCERAGPPDAEEALACLAGIRAVLAGERAEFSVEYACHGPGDERWFRLLAVPLGADRSAGAVVLHVDVTERRRAQRALRESDQSYRLLFTSNPVPMWVYDQETLLFLATNETAVRHYGYTADEFLAMRITELRPPEDVPALLDELGRIATEGAPERVGAWRHRLKDGRVIDVSVRSTPLVFEGRPARLVLATDVTERRRAHEALRVSEERFRMLSQATHDAIWDWDLETDALWWNDGVEHLFGYEVDELEPTSASRTRLIHPEDAARVTGDLDRAIKAGEVQWSAEYRFARKDGSYAYVLDRSYLIRDAQGEAVRMIGGMTDLTARKEAEQRLAQQAALIDAASDAIMVRGLDRRIQFWSRGAEALYGWSRGEAVGRDVTELLVADPDQLARAELAVLEGSSWSGELQLRAKDGDVLTVLARWTLMCDAAGTPEALLVIDTDITERRRLELQFLRAQRLESLGTLAAGIAHDLNNVLTPITMSLELLAEAVPTQDGRALVEVLRASAQRGAALVEQVLGFARGAEARRARLQPLALAREVQRIVEETFPRSIAFELTASAAPWPIEADATQLHQVLLNLCVNARDAMPAGGSLTVAIENFVVDEVYAGLNVGARAGPYVVIRVEDTGCGIPPERQERIFEPFFTTKEPGHGTGLGLSTCFSIVQAHGGFMHVYSEVGKGTKFKVFLPASASSEAQASATVEQSRLPRGHGELILIVEDEAEVREVASKALERFGYRVLLAAHGAEAVALYAEHRGEIAAVLTDMNMPIMDGPATIVALKSLDPSVLVIGSSGLRANGKVAKAIGAGVEHFVPKPYTASALLETLHEVLSPRRGAAASTPPEGARPAPSTALTRPAEAAGPHRRAAAGATILIAEDVDDLRELARAALERAGYRVLTATSGAEALRQLTARQAEVDLLLTDFGLTALSGPELAARARAANPSLAVIYMSGDADGARQEVAEPVLGKPFSLDDLVRAVRRALG